MTPNKQIRQMISEASATLVADMVREWCNCDVAEIDADGDIWIAEPMAGHWLSADDKAEFIEWASAQ